MLEGRYPALYTRLYPELAPQVLPGDMELISQPVDFVGINYYTRGVVSYDQERLVRNHPPGDVEPDVILADEPISMLDVSIRLGILNLMMDLKDQHDIAFMYITHDIATARYFAERTAVMYVGHMVEWGNSDAVTQNPRHPYTQLLLAAVPQPGAKKGRDMSQYQHKADIPMWQPESTGCPFAQRCPHARPECSSRLPEVTRIAKDHFVRCYLYE
ncbi:oligopeptide/dipeptide ABC transporter ATP-binding protein [Halomonas sp. CKK8]|uniref:oligopeptide/dipeptide ABC transporter ATP-binding protein n=1 Tax=Halomonas sp. CKK8 TaxID=3036127 RepID=UPI0024151F48|nr:oligopeptide/dipeptide ABC transporter ATP-binding protein [Halomonas sp. CKK8]WFM71060.1 family 1 glycosylhydrolase [Halomonas sp. CKK8]